MYSFPCTDHLSVKTLRVPRKPQCQQKRSRRKNMLNNSLSTDDKGSGNPSSAQTCNWLAILFSWEEVDSAYRWWKYLFFFPQSFGYVTQWKISIIFYCYPFPQQVWTLSRESLPCVRCSRKKSKTFSQAHSSYSHMIAKSLLQLKL